jgi:streptogramin lyase
MDNNTNRRNTRLQRTPARRTNAPEKGAIAVFVAAAALALLPGCHQDYAKNIPSSGSSSAPAGAVLTTKTITSGITSGAVVDGLVAGPDGRMWFTETNTAQIGATTTAGAVQQYAITAPSGYTCVTPQNIIVGPDGNLWAAAYCGELIKITTAGSATVYGVNANAAYSAIAVGPDKNIWLGDQTNAQLTVISTSGTLVRNIPLPSGASPAALALGSDGNMWVADFALSAIERVTTNGTVTSFTSGIPTGVTIAGIVAAPDGNLYFTAPAIQTTSTDQVGRIATSGKITMLGSLSSGSSPVGITADTKGNVWFRDNGTTVNACGSIVTATGTIAQYSLSGITSPNVPNDGGGDVSGTAVIGPDANLWLGGSGTIYVATPP